MNAPDGQRGPRGVACAAGFILIAGLFACDGSAGADAGRPDAGNVDVVVGACDVGPAPASYDYPAGPYGTDEGDIIADFTLSDCAGNDIAFSDILSRSELVLLNVGAGWCAPCIEETQTLQAEIFEPFCGRGLDVVQVLFQDAQAAPATKLFCENWRTQYGLTFPLLIDPLFITGAYFEAVSTPMNMLVDPNGRIVFKEVGLAPEGMAERIESFLPPE